MLTSNYQWSAFNCMHQNHDQSNHQSQSELLCKAKAAESDTKQLMKPALSAGEYK